MQYEVIDNKGMGKFEDKINQALEKTSVVNEGRLMLGNYIVLVNVVKENDKKVNVTKIEIKRYSNDLGDVAVNEFLDLDYFRKLARVLSHLDKRDETIEVVFSESAKTFLKDHNVTEQIQSSIPNN